MRTAFQGDAEVLQAACVEVRSHFRNHADAVEPDLSARIDEGHQAVTLLRESVVQGKMNERGNYGAHLLDVDD